MSKVLVTYFSCSGVTARVAKEIAKAAEADLFEIEPEVAYTKEDLNWMDKQSRSSVEMANPDSRPAIAKKLSNMADYEVVFVGFPIWWYVAPTIIHTFLESYDFAGKTIVPFCTSGGSGVGETGEKLKAICPDTVKWADCKLLKGNVFADELKDWVGSLI